MCVKFVFMFIFFAVFAFAQQLTQEATMRNTNSVEIQVCVPSNIVLSSVLENAKTRILSDFKSLVQSSAVYYLRTYTNTVSSGTCFMYVFQANSPKQAQEGVIVLSSKNTVRVGDESSEQIIQVNTKVVPWTGMDEQILGLGWDISGNDIIMWGVGFGCLLLLCIIGMCFYVQLATTRQQANVDKWMSTGAYKK